MTSIILAGVGRSGKTNLAKRLQRETGFTRISGDKLVSAIEMGFPELGIKQSGAYRDEACRKLAPFWAAYLKKFAQPGQVPFILDTVHILPEQIVEYGLHEIANVIFMGYPDIDPHEKLAAIRAHPSPGYDWTSGMSDEGVLSSIDLYIRHSQEIRQSCIALGLTFIDTGPDFAAAQEKAHRLALSPTPISG